MKLSISFSFSPTSPLQLQPKITQIVQPWNQVWTKSIPFSYYNKLNFLLTVLIFLKVSGRRRISPAWGSRHFLCSISAEESYFPLSFFFFACNRHSSIVDNNFYTPHSCLISCSHSIRKHPPTWFKTEQLVCVRIVKILNQKRPLQPSALTPFGHRTLLVSSRNSDLAKQGRDMAQLAESNRWTSLGLLFHGLLNLKNIPVLPICVFNL